MRDAQNHQPGCLKRLRPGSFSFTRKLYPAHGRLANWQWRRAHTEWDMLPACLCVSGREVVPVGRAESKLAACSTLGFESPGPAAGGVTFLLHLPHERLTTLRLGNAKEEG